MFGFQGKRGISARHFPSSLELIVPFRSQGSRKGKSWFVTDAPVLRAAYRASVAVLVMQPVLILRYCLQLIVCQFQELALHLQLMAQQSSSRDRCTPISKNHYQSTAGGTESQAFRDHALMSEARPRIEKNRLRPLTEVIRCRSIVSSCSFRGFSAPERSAMCLR